MYHCYVHFVSHLVARCEMYEHFLKYEVYLFMKLKNIAAESREKNNINSQRALILSGLALNYKNK